MEAPSCRGTKHFIVLIFSNRVPIKGSKLDLTNEDIDRLIKEKEQEILKETQIKNIKKFNLARSTRGQNVEVKKEKLIMKTGNQTKELKLDNQKNALSLKVENKLKFLTGLTTNDLINKNPNELEEILKGIRNQNESNKQQVQGKVDSNMQFYKSYQIPKTLNTVQHPQDLLMPVNKQDAIREQGRSNKQKFELDDSVSNLFNKSLNSSQSDIQGQDRSLRSSKLKNSVLSQNSKGGDMRASNLNDPRYQKPIQKIQSKERQFKEKNEKKKSAIDRMNEKLDQRKREMEQKQKLKEKMSIKNPANFEQEDQEGGKQPDIQQHANQMVSTFQNDNLPKIEEEEDEEEGQRPSTSPLYQTKPETMITDSFMAPLEDSNFANPFSTSSAQTPSNQKKDLPDYLKAPNKSGKTPFLSPY